MGVTLKDMLRLQGLCERIAVPAGFSSSVVQGHADADYYHYLCDGTDDRVGCLFCEAKRTFLRVRVSHRVGGAATELHSLCVLGQRVRDTRVPARP